jgi:hypothetical protein
MQTVRLLKVFYVIMHIKVLFTIIHDVTEHPNLFHRKPKFKILQNYLEFKQEFQNWKQKKGK